jgi:YVTN family beta-propeller protein
VHPDSFPASLGLHHRLWAPAHGVSPRRGGLVFTANGGTDDVSVIDVARALAGDPAAEIARIPVALGPWGLAVSPDGALVAVANRESARSGVEGNTVSIIDVEKAAAAAKDAEAVRLLVGTNNPATATRPFSLAFTPDGQQLIVSNFRANNVSFVDVKKALAGELGAETARIRLDTPSGGPSRPRGIVVTPDGRYAAITGAAAGAVGAGEFRAPGGSAPGARSAVEPPSFRLSADGGGNQFPI